MKSFNQINDDNATTFKYIFSGAGKDVLKYVKDVLLVLFCLFF